MIFFSFFIFELYNLNFDVFESFFCNKIFLYCNVFFFFEILFSFWFKWFILVDSVLIFEDFLLVLVFDFFFCWFNLKECDFFNWSIFLLCIFLFLVNLLVWLNLIFVIFLVVCFFILLRFKVSFLYVFL